MKTTKFLVPHRLQLPITGVVAWGLLLERLWSYAPWAQIAAGAVGLVALIWSAAVVAYSWHAERVDVPEELAKLKSDVDLLKRRTA